MKKKLRRKILKNEDIFNRGFTLKTEIDEELSKLYYSEITRKYSKWII